MYKSWVGALAALLLLSGCESTGEPAEPSSSEAVVQQPVAPSDVAQAPAASADSTVAEGDAEVEVVALDDEVPQDLETGAHPELGPLYPVVSVYDGDTIAVTVGGIKERVRVIGIDAPEMARYGNPADCYAQESASQMQSMVQSSQVHLLADPTQADRDRYDRLLRHVVLDDADHSLAALLMVEGGYAVERQYAAPYQHQSDLQAAQDRASAAGLGLWSACPATPPAPTEPAPVVKIQPDPAVTEDCVIKGNIASDGEKIYHVPGQRHYDDTVISPEKGERWFCSEEEARDAGWRRAKV